MKSTDPVFPEIQSPDADFTFRAQGLTKREYFAAQVLAGYLTDEHLGPHQAAEAAVRVADALIEELEKSK